MKITRSELRKLILREMSEKPLRPHKPDRMRDYADIHPANRTPGQARSLAGAPYGAPGGHAQYDDLPDPEGPYWHEEPDHEAHEGILAQQEAYEEYLEILDALNSHDRHSDISLLIARMQEIQDTWGFDL